MNVVFLIFSSILSIIFIAGVIYLLMSVIGALFPVNKQFKSSNKGIDIFLSTNGLHTDFILPCQNNIVDWTDHISINHFEVDILNEYYFGIGWGDRAVFIDIDKWNELTLKMGFNALFIFTPSILHITAYEQLPIDQLKICKITISSDQYQQLCQYILHSFSKTETSDFKLIPKKSTTANDIFYEANGKYHALNTCNTWVNNGLKLIGVRTALWTSLDKGLFHQLNKIDLLSIDKQT